MPYRRPRRRRRRLRKEFIMLVAVLAVSIVILLAALLKDEPDPTLSNPSQGNSQSSQDSGDPNTSENSSDDQTDYQPPVETTPEQWKISFMQEHNLTEDDYIEQMFEVYEYFPEVREFLLNYPLKKDSAPTSSSIAHYDRTNGVPLFIQWDEAWGYTPYGKGVCGISACGAVCLSMVSYYLSGNTEHTPHYMMKFAEDNHHVGSGGGTNWSLFSKGAKDLGYDVKEVPLDEGAIRKKLQAGIPIVVNVGPGDFTRNGHYMVLVDYVDGMIRINDPFSKINSEKLWSYEQIKGQIKNLWAISNKS